MSVQAALARIRQGIGTGDRLVPGTISEREAEALAALAEVEATLAESYFVFDPDPIGPEWPPLVGPFPTKFAAETYANQSHPEDMDGNTVVLQATAPDSSPALSSRLPKEETT